MSRLSGACLPAGESTERSNSFLLVQGEYPMKIIKQFGLQRSGTNAVKAMLEVNFPDVFILTNILGNKHECSSRNAMAAMAAELAVSEPELDKALVEEIQNCVGNGEIAYIFNIKDPVSWLCSYFRYQKKKYEFRNPDSEFMFSEKFARRSLSAWQEKVPMISRRRPARGASSCSMRCYFAMHPAFCRKSNASSAFAETIKCGNWRYSPTPMPNAGSRPSTGST